MGCEWEKMRSQLGPGSRLLISTLWRSMKYILLWFVPWVQVLIVCRIHWCHSAFALQTATYITLLHITATPHTSSHMAPRLDLSVEAVAQLLPRLQTPEQHGWTGTTSVDVASRARYDLLRLATTCYDLLRLATTWRSVTYPLHILYTLHSILSMPAQSAHCSVTLSDSNVRFVTSVPGDCGCDLPTADPVPTLQWAAMHNPPVPGRSSRLVFQYRSILRKESQRNLEKVSFGMLW